MNWVGNFIPNPITMQRPCGHTWRRQESRMVWKFSGLMHEHPSYRSGILNAGSDFNLTTTPYDVGLGRFVDEDKGDFIGKSALQSVIRKTRLFGIKCMGGEPVISGAVRGDENAREP